MSSVTKRIALVGVAALVVVALACDGDTPAQFNWGPATGADVPSASGSAGAAESFCQEALACVPQRRDDRAASATQGPSLDSLYSQCVKQINDQLKSWELDPSVVYSLLDCISPCDLINNPNQAVEKVLVCLQAVGITVPPTTKQPQPRQDAGVSQRDAFVFPRRDSDLPPRDGPGRFDGQ